MGVDAVEMSPCGVQTAYNQGCPNVALVPAGQGGEERVTSRSCDLTPTSVTSHPNL